MYVHARAKKNLKLKVLKHKKIKNNKIIYIPN